MKHAEEYRIEQLKPTDYLECTALFGNNCPFASVCREQRRTGNREAYALRVNGKMVAECHLVYSNPEYGTIPGERVYFSRMVTRKEYRRQGYGEAIARHILTLAKENGFREIALGVNCDNAAAVHLYQKLGFSVYETAKDAYGTYYRMQKTL